MEPEAPPVATPVENAIEPGLPPADEPVKTRTYPESPVAALSLATVSDVAPLKDTEDVPLLMTKFPPGLEAGTTYDTAPRMFENKY